MPKGFLPTRNAFAEASADGLDSENLISFDEVASRAKEAGVNFGKTKPANRFRYLTKIGLLPKASRRPFNGALPSGAYPEDVVASLVEIEGKLKAGKSIQAVLREQRAESSEQEGTTLSQRGAAGLPPLMITPIPVLRPIPETPRMAGIPSEKGPPVVAPLVSDEPPPREELLVERLIPQLPLVIVAAILVTLGYLPLVYLSNPIFRNDTNGIVRHLYSLGPWAAKQETATLKMPSSVEQVLGTISNPYLTINVETDVNKLLNAKGGINTHDKDVNAGSGSVFASNILYGISAGNNVAIGGPPQNPTISVPNVGNGDITAVLAGSGLSGGSYSGSVTLGLTNSSLTVAAGAGLTGGGVVSLGGTTTLNIDLESGSGLSTTTGKLSLLRSCGPGELLKWIGGAWTCAGDAGGSVGVIEVQEGNDPNPVWNDVSRLRFNETDFNVSHSTPIATLTIDYTSSGITRQNQTQNITGTWNLTDSTVSFQDEGDNTKKMQFQLAGIGASTTRTLTVPNENGTICTTGSVCSGYQATGSYVSTSRNLTAGNGLTGGGDLSADRTFAVGAGNGITVNTDDVAVNQAYGFAWTGAHSFTNASGITLGLDATTPTPNTAGYLKFISAGDTAFSTVFQAGTQTADVTYTLPLADGTAGQALVTNGSGALSWSTPAGMGDITKVTAGNGLSGGGDSGDVTLSVNQAYGFAWTGAHSFTNASGITLGLDATTPTPNTAGYLKFISAGDTAFSTVFQAGTQTADVTYTLPLADGTAGQALITNGTGTLSWSTPAGMGTITGVTAGTGLGGGGSSGTVTLNVDQAYGFAWTGAHSFTNSAGVSLNPYGIATGNTSELRFLELAAGGSNYTGFKAPDALAGNVTYTLPLADGTAGQALITNGTGTLSWSTPAGMGDITAVGSMTSGATFADTGAGGNWLGLGASAGRIAFNDQATDYVNILSANVGIGTATPGQTLTINGTLGILEGGTSPTYHTILQGGDQGGDITYTLPAAYPGANNYVLTSQTDGTLSWTLVNGASGLSGSCTSPTSVAFYTGTNPSTTLGCNSNFYWDNTNQALSVTTLLGQTGLSVTTPAVGSGTTTAFGITTGAASAGTLYGINIAAASGASTSKTAINIGSGWDTGLNISASPAESAITITSNLTAARSTDVMTITQANDTTYNSTGNLLQLTNADTGSTAALLDINQVDAGTGINFPNQIYTGTGINFSSNIGGSGGTGINFSGTIYNYGYGIRFAGVGTGAYGFYLGQVLEDAHGIAINAANLTSGQAIAIFGITTSGLGASSGFTGDVILINPSRTLTSAEDMTDSGNYLDITRNNTISSAGHTYTVSGDLVTFASTCSQSNGTCTDTSSILKLNQQYANASGAVLNILNSGTGAGINIAIPTPTSGTVNGINFSNVTSNGGSVNAINIGTHTKNGAGTETAINIGSGWDNIIAAGNFIALGAGNVAGTANLSLGAGAGNSISTGTQNTFFGVGAGGVTTQGSLNVFIGTGAGGANIEATSNTAVGVGALSSYAGSGNTGNTAVGNGALSLSAGGIYNTAVGQTALYYNAGGSYNTAVGRETGGSTNSGGTYGTFIGYQARATANNLTNATAIGSNAMVGESNALILGNGANVGIGTSVPDTKLQVSGGGLCVGSDANCNSDNNTEGVVYSSSTAMTVYDVAETYPTKDKTIEAGELVSSDNVNAVFVDKSSSAYDSKLLGVISTKPAVLLGGFKTDQSEFIGETQVAVTLSGRVPTKVSTENGSIAIGDPLTSSSTPGVAMKATQSGPIVGKALAAYDNSNPTAVGKIMVFVSVGWYVTPLGNGDGSAQQFTNIDAQTLAAGTINTQVLMVGNVKFSMDGDGGLQIDSNVKIAGDLTAQNLIVLKEIKAPKVTTTEVDTEKLNISTPAATPDAKNHASVGTGTVTAGQTNVVIETTAVTASSKVFVTATTSSGGQALIVSGKKAGTSFTVTLDHSITNAVQFDWFIVN